jgi:hypothetical protein
MKAFLIGFSALYSSAVLEAGGGSSSSDRKCPGPLPTAISGFAASKLHESDRGRSAEKRDARPPNLEGSVWKFATTTTVQFLPKGEFLWNGMPEKGTWKQKGKLITINVNDSLCSHSRWKAIR